VQAFGLEGKHRSGIALAVCHRLSGLPADRLKAFRREKSPYSKIGQVVYMFPVLFQEYDIPHVCLLV